MSQLESVHGLSCPNCGGMVPVPEGAVIVHCPYCELRSMVQGERGLHRYQVSQRIDRAQALQAMYGFLSSSRAIAGATAKQAQVAEAFVAFLPFWVSWTRVLGWVFGEEKVGSGDDARYEPREIKIAEEMNWNGAAVDVGEFGVDSIYLTDQQLQAFDPQALHASGLVFEPVGSASQAREKADEDFSERVRRLADLDRVGQVFVRFVRRRMGLIYYPLWVIRYLYRQRAYQVVVDGFSGKVLYGKAPGNTLYRAAVLVGGMLLGAVLAVDVSALLIYFTAGDSDTTELFAVAVFMFLLGLGLMRAAYRRFRYGELYEYRSQAGQRKKRSRKKVGRIYRAREVG